MTQHGMQEITSTNWHRVCRNIPYDLTHSLIAQLVEVRKSIHVQLTNLSGQTTMTVPFYISVIRHGVVISNSARALTEYMHAGRPSFLQFT